MTAAVSEKPRSRALVVDDVSFNRRLMSTALLCDGLVADEASDVEQAIEALQKGAYEVVLLDLALGDGGSGYDVLRAIRSRPDLDDLPVLLVSGASNDPASIAEGLLAGANDFVTKPFDPMVLRARVAAARRSRKVLLEVRARADHLDTEAARARDELTHARLVQQASLPRVPVRISNFRVTGEVVPSGHVSGDLFDVVADHSGRVAIFLLDVAGHGAPAAIVASAARASLRNTLRAGESLESVMASLVTCLRAHGDVPEATAAVAIVRFNAPGDQVEVVNAGLPPLVCIGPTGGVKDFQSTSAPAGLFETTHHVAETSDIDVGSLFILTSDGLRGGNLDDDNEQIVARFDVAGRGTHFASASKENVRALILELMAAYGASDDDDATLVLIANDDAPATLRAGFAI
ncbi:MAG TPA: SpoIIE family protein phosphatase [Polyangiaceae bacterium]|nr:SpoIIE family protein phosphatase [Polyangiaceae bacterium]